MAVLAPFDELHEIIGSGAIVVAILCALVVGTRPYKLAGLVMILETFSWLLFAWMFDRYDRVILDVHDADNSFRVVSPRITFPLDTWGELFVMYSRYVYGDKIQLRPGQVPLETEPDTDVFKVQAQAVW